MTTFKMLPTTADMAMIRAGAKAAREYLLETGGNNPAVIYEAMVATALEQASHAEPIATDKLRFALQLAKDMIVSNGLSVPHTMEVIDHALKATPQPGDSPLLAN